MEICLYARNLTIKYLLSFVHLIEKLRTKFSQSMSKKSKIFMTDIRDINKIFNPKDFLINEYEVMSADSFTITYFNMFVMDKIKDIKDKVKINAYFEDKSIENIVKKSLKDIEVNYLSEISWEKIYSKDMDILIIIDPSPGAKGTVMYIKIKNVDVWASAGPHALFILPSL
jgi:hypothetical protein